MDEKNACMADFLSPDIPFRLPEYGMGAPVIRDYQEVLP
jgi:hypothetical protein